MLLQEVCTDGMLTYKVNIAAPGKLSTPPNKHCFTWSQCVLVTHDVVVYVMITAPDGYEEWNRKLVMHLTVVLCHVKPVYIFYSQILLGLNYLGGGLHSVKSPYSYTFTPKKSGNHRGLKLSCMYLSKLTTYIMCFQIQRTVLIITKPHENCKDHAGLVLVDFSFVFHTLQFFTVPKLFKKMRKKWYHSGSEWTGSCLTRCHVHFSFLSSTHRNRDDVLDHESLATTQQLCQVIR